MMCFARVSRTASDSRSDSKVMPLARSDRQAPSNAATRMRTSSGLKTPPAYLSMALSITCPAGGRLCLSSTMLFLLSMGGNLKRYFPNVLGVLADGPVGGEPRHSRDVEHTRARPIGGRQPQPFDASLRCVIGIEIDCHHVVVGMPQRVHERSEAIDIVGGKNTGLDRSAPLRELGRRCNN